MANPAYFTSAPVTKEIPQTELNFHLYMYQWMEGTPSGNEKRAVAVGGRNAFGSIYANDWTMYDGPDPNANLVARVQGVHTNCDMVLPDSWLVCASIVFVDQRYVCLISVLIELICFSLFFLLLEDSCDLLYIYVLPYLRNLFFIYST
jgi:hypothetical protein